jgi:signal transduction histidine kinase/ActR/RegA family two-component response regulator
MTKVAKAAQRDAKILAVDDSPTQLQQLEYLLGEAGFAVLTAKDGKQALAAAKAHQPRLVITDIVMPEMDGYALCQALRADEQLREVPIILLTALTDPNDVLKGLQCGANSFVSKPYEAQHLLSCVESCWANQRLHNEAGAGLRCNVFFRGREHVIDADPRQVLELLLSTYENAVQRNTELVRARGELVALNEELEERVRERTAALTAEIEERKRMQQKLHESMQHLAGSNAELEQFAYVVSHDLQEPLRMVTSYVQLLADRYKDRLDSDANEFISYAVDGTARMKSMTTDLLAYSRVGRDGKESVPVNCEAALSQACADLRAAITEAAAEVTHDPLPSVVGNAGQFAHLFQNLIGNAIKFHGQEPPRIHVSAVLNKQEWVFSVHDNGIGLDPQYADRIFMVFQRLHRRDEYPGTGIGLAIARKIVEHRGGRIWVESEPGKGATFRFTIPVCPPGDTA